MHDNLTKEQRQKCMSSVQREGTTPEMIVRRTLFSRGFRYRVNYGKLPGRPDIVLPKYSLAIMINGCFWHRHENCTRAKVPITNREYWMRKLNKNVTRDQRLITELRELGWNVLILWECEIMNGQYLEKLGTITKEKLK